jgi:hypothetical protein
LLISYIHQLQVVCQSSHMLLSLPCPLPQRNLHVAVRVKSIAISQSLGKHSQIVHNGNRPHLEPVLSSGATHSLAWVRITIGKTNFNSYQGSPPILSTFPHRQRFPASAIIFPSCILFTPTSIIPLTPSWFPLSDSDILPSTPTKANPPIHPTSKLSSHPTGKLARCHHITKDVPFTLSP